jgi:hypothetical protein
VLESSMYLKEKGRPVVVLWGAPFMISFPFAAHNNPGFGFSDRDYKPETVRNVFAFIRNNTPGGAYIMAGGASHALGMLTSLLTLTLTQSLPTGARPCQTLTRTRTGLTSGSTTSMRSHRYAFRCAPCVLADRFCAVDYRSVRRCRRRGQLRGGED